MTLKIHDTLRREKLAFEPLDPARVTLYVCGPTVYNYAHIGNARPVVAFDVLFRLLRRLYGDDAVIYARNVTDVDDKINQAAIDQGVAISVITDRFTAIYEADMAALGALAPTMQPRATAHVPQMLAMIARLVEAGHAYAAEGHVLFDVSSFPAYGALSGRSLDEMVAGARVEVAAYKRNPADFVLWKPSKPGEPVWESAFGPGRPGWHIECSAMIEAELGFPVDIHGGGHDLIFPHHENELAQGVCAQHGGAQGDGEYSRYWMHNGFLTLDAEKMSKSVGNVLLVHELVKSVPGEVVRWALLSAHYRAPLDWTADLLDQSRRSLDRLYRVIHDARRQEVEGLTPDPVRVLELAAPVVEAVEDDLNTPQAMSELFKLADQVRAALSGSVLEATTSLHALLDAGALLGFLQADPDAWFQGGADAGLKTRVEDLIARRAQARLAKDWPAADLIRAELTELKVEVLDGPGGTATWRLKD
ncbi:cysteine--tRNA ligase [Caulobacter sp. S45]|uniref:cysteine--tRNA ligase n=1 Tax=Caulobacter sp. S45 TaxID=1641861 RepID=UPI00131ECBDD|nr:cysteine--tRNA ligase [Caulobacter sp. S45]